MRCRVVRSTARRTRRRRSGRPSDASEDWLCRDKRVSPPGHSPAQPEIGQVMPRRARPTDRAKVADRKYANVTVQQFINKVMPDGKRSTAEGIVYDAVERAEQATRKPAVEVFETAMKNATPLLEVKPRRVGGATYQVPVEIPAARRGSLAMRWLIQSA